MSGVAKSWGMRRPKVYGDCIGRPLPCPWVACKYHTLIDVSPKTGTITINSATGARKPGRRHLPTWATKTDHSEARIDEIVEVLEASADSCVLHIVRGDKASTLEVIGEVLNVSRERIRQIEERALMQLRADADELGAWSDD